MDMLRSGRILAAKVRVPILTGVPPRRFLCHTPAQWLKKMPDRPKPPHEDDFTEVFVKGSGPGGQKINKTSSAVQLKHRATGIVVKVQDTRSQQQNRKLARQKLAERLDDLEKGDMSRAAVVRRAQSKKKQSAAKKSRRKYRALDAAKAASSKEDGSLEASEDEASAQ